MRRKRLVWNNKKITLSNRGFNTKSVVWCNLPMFPVHKRIILQLNLNMTLPKTWRLYKNVLVFSSSSSEIFALIIITIGNKWTLYYQQSLPTWRCSIYQLKATDPGNYKLMLAKWVGDGTVAGRDMNGSWYIQVEPLICHVGIIGLEAGLHMWLTM